MAELGRIAATTDRVTHAEYSLEVLDMDGKRVDKLLVSAPRNDTGV